MGMEVRRATHSKSELCRGPGAPGLYLPPVNLTKEHALEPGREVLTSNPITG